MFNPWRDHLDVHPAADLFPLMSESELRELGEDIKKHGLSNPVTLWYADGKLYLLDGRNRLDAMEKIGIQFFSTLKEIRTPNGKLLSKTLPDPPGIYGLKTDPYAYVLSANIHRRHLTPDQKRDLIAKVLKATPEKSNNQIAKDVKVDDKTVAKVRTELESTSDIPKLEKTVGKDGKARKQRKKPSPEEAHERSKRRSAKKVAAIKATLTTLNGQAVKTADLGPAAQEQLTKALEPDADASAEAMKARMAALDAPPIVPTPEAPPAPESTTTETMIQSATAKSENERNEIVRMLDARLPKLMTVDKEKLFSYVINHPALASVKVPKREKAAA